MVRKVLLHKSREDDSENRPNHTNYPKQCLSSHLGGMQIHTHLFEIFAVFFCQFRQ